MSDLIFIAFNFRAERAEVGATVVRTFVGDTKRLHSRSAARPAFQLKLPRRRLPEPIDPLRRARCRA